MAEPKKKPSRLKELLGRPEARGPVSRAVVSLLAAALVSMAVLGALLIWHMARRARLIRQKLGPPRPIRWPDQGEDEDEESAARAHDIPHDETGSP
jgi:hypothetical protein